MYQQVLQDTINIVITQVREKSTDADEQAKAYTFTHTSTQKGNRCNKSQSSKPQSFYPVYIVLLLCSYIITLI